MDKPVNAQSIRQLLYIPRVIQQCPVGLKGRTTATGAIRGDNPKVMAASLLVKEPALQPGTRHSVGKQYRCTLRVTKIGIG